MPRLKVNPTRKVCKYNVSKFCVVEGPVALFKGKKCKHCLNHMQREYFKEYYKNNRAKWYKSKGRPVPHPACLRV